MVGISGKARTRKSLDTASALTWFDSMKERAPDMLEKYTSTSPRRTPTIAGLPPAYGIWVAVAPPRLARSSPARWGALPVPEEAYENRASLRCGPAMRSRTLAMAEF